MNRSWTAATGTANGLSEYICALDITLRSGCFLQMKSLFNRTCKKYEKGLQENAKNRLICFHPLL